MLHIKKLSHQIAASFSKLDNTVNNNSISNTKFAEFSIKLQVLSHFHDPECAYQHLYNLHQKYVLLLQSTLTSLFHPYLFTKSSLQSPPTLTSSIPQQFFTSLLLAYNHPNGLHQKIFSLPHPFDQFRLHQETRELGSLVRTSTVLIFLFSLKVRAVIRGLTITDFYSSGSEKWRITCSFH